MSSTTRPLSPAHLPLDPPPAFFSTPSPLRIRKRSFEPFSIPSRSRNLVDGFPLLYAPALATHGIAEADWVRFLQDMQVSARLALGGLNIRGERPRALAVGGVVGFLVGGSRGSQYDAAFAKSPLEQVTSLVEVYNQSAWERRKVRVTFRPKVDVDAGLRRGYELLVEAL